MRRFALVLCVASALLAALGMPAAGEVYRVGPGENYAKVSQVVGMLEAGDVVEVTGDIEDSFTLHKHGFHDKPITIRGVTRVENGRIVRPRITLTGFTPYGITCDGDWNVLEGLDITKPSDAETPAIAVFFKADNLRVRNCRIHHITNGLRGFYGRNVVVEFCEFDTTAKSFFCSLSPEEVPREAKVVVQYCWFHDNTGDIFFYSRYPRIVIRYNWFEASHHSALQTANEIVASWRSVSPGRNPRPMHTDIVGNVFHQGWSPGPKYDLLQLGGESAQAAGTEGDYHIAHNLFLMTRERSAAITVHGNVDRVLLHNNVFLEYGVGGGRLYERGTVWETAETTAFKDRRGHGEPVIIGANNWVSAKMTGVPEELEGTIRGRNPRFVDLVNLDFTPARVSPLAGAGFFPLPQGRVVELTPEYEPQRGIPLDLKPTPRRKAAPPAIGPFEAAGAR